MLRKSYNEVIKALHILAENKKQTATTRNEARILQKELNKFVNALNVDVRDNILQNMYQSSKTLHIQSTLMSQSFFYKLI